MPDRTITQIKKECDLFEKALAAAREEIHQLQIRAQSLLSVAEQALFDAYMRILDSRSLMNEIIEEIEGGQWAQGAFKRVIKRHIMHFEAFEDVYLRERAADFRDLGRRILSHLQTEKRESPELSQKNDFNQRRSDGNQYYGIPRNVWRESFRIRFSQFTCGDFSAIFRNADGDGVYRSGDGSIIR